MNKKIMVFGILGLFAIAIVSSVVVNYLSDTAEVEVSVDYATIVSLANVADDTFPLTRTDEWSSELVIPDTTQLSTILAGVQIINNADVRIEGKNLRVVVSNGLGNVGCGDITYFGFLDTATQTQLDKGYQDLTGLCSEDETSIYYDIPINSLLEDTTYEYPAKITFGVVEPTDYQFTAQMTL